MAAPETQNPNAGNAPALAGDTLPATRPVLAEHDWVTYVMALGVVLGVVGASLLLVSNFRPHTTMIFIGAICLATASIVWVGLFGYFTWKIGGIVLPILRLRFRSLGATDRT